MSVHDHFAGLLLGVALLAALVATVVLTFAGAPGGPGRPVLVIAPPWSPGPAEIVRRAGGRLIGPTEAPMGILALFDGPVPRADLKRLGSWAVADGRRLAAICGVIEND